MDINKLHQYFLHSTGVSTDTRTLKIGQIYFALKGENFDGNQYATQALEKGAMFVVIDDKSLPHDTDRRYLLVDNTLKSLQELATAHRLHCKAIVIGITGSNGKTTTKELLSTVLGSTYQVNATVGNLNNHIGVPLTLLNVTDEIEYSIVEMGANKPDDIEELCQIALPDYGYITNIGSAHLDGFGDIKGVYEGKTALFRYIKESGEKCFVNQFDPFLIDFELNEDKVQNLDNSLVVLDTDNIELSLDLNGRSIHTNLTGGYNLHNINAAITIGKFFNVPIHRIVSSIEQYIPVNRRSQVIREDGYIIILDAYNANPSSMKVALKNAIDVTPETYQTIAIIGSMYELGEESLELHQELINYAMSLGYKKLILIGDLMIEAVENLEHSIEISTYKTAEEFKPIFEEMDKDNSVILIKGSRGVKLESLITH